MFQAAVRGGARAEGRLPAGADAPQALLPVRPRGTRSSRTPAKSCCCCRCCCCRLLPTAACSLLLLLLLRLRLRRLLLLLPLLLLLSGETCKCIRTDPAPVLQPVHGRPIVRPPHQGAEYDREAHPRAAVPLRGPGRHLRAAAPAPAPAPCSKCRLPSDSVALITSGCAAGDGREGGRGGGGAGAEGRARVVTLCSVAIPIARC